MPATSTHPSSAALVAYGQGKLSMAEMSAIESHLATCSSCGEALAATPDDTLLLRAREAATSGFRAREQTLPTKPASPSEIPQPLRDHPRYRVLGLIGAGGMGAVYKAEHRLMERLVALKVINPALVSSPAALERFEREVKTAAKLSHPNIVVAHDAEQAGDLHYLVMEFVEGVSLDRYVVANGPLSPNMAASLISNAALGLQHAHEKGMIHRDIKPQNLMRQHRDGVLKILDFGLARLATEAWQSSPENMEAADRAEDATRAGALLGTPDYIAPEQATDAHRADIRADIYSLGCTLYFLLTGEPPFPGGTALDKVHAHQTCTPTPIRLRRPEVPEELAQILDRMLAKNPADRFARPGDLVKLLRPIAQAKPTTTAAAPNAIKVTPLPAATVLSDPEPTPPALDNLSLDLLGATALPVVSNSLPASRSKPRKPRPEVSPLLWIGAAVTAVLMIATTIWLLIGGGKQDINKGKQQIAKQQQTAKKDDAGKGATLKSDGNEVVTPPVAPPINNAAAKPKTEPPKSTVVTPPADTRKQVLMLLPQNDLFYPDYFHVLEGLPKGSVKLVTAAARSEPVRLSSLAPGQRVTPDLALSNNIKAADYEAIVFVGAESPELCGGAAGPQVKRLLNEFQAAKKPICALCAGQHVPAYHGIFQAGTRVAGGRYVRDHVDFKNSASTDRESQNVVVDPVHRLITGQEYTHGGELAGEIARMIGASYP